MADDFSQYGTPVAGGANPPATSAVPQSQPQGQAQPAQATNDQYSQYGESATTTPPTTAAPTDNGLNTKQIAGAPNLGGVAEFAKQTGLGIGEKALESVAGLEDLISRFVPKELLTPENQQKLHNTLHNLASGPKGNINSGPVVEAPKSVGEKFGGLVGDVMEYMTGEKAFDALANTDKVLEAAKLVKVIDKYPKLAAAVKAAVRGATVQGAQTLVNTGGDVHQAAHDAKTMGAVAGVLGGGAAAIASKLPKFGEAAETMNRLSQTAEAAPTEQELVGQIQKPVGQALESAKAGQEAETAAATSAKESAIDAAKSKQTSTDKYVANAHETQKQNVADAVAENVGKAQEKIATGAKGAEEAHAGRMSEAHKQVVDSLSQLSAGAPVPEDMAEKIDQAINETEKATHAKYEEGITGENGIETRIGKDITNPAKGGPISEAAADAIKSPVPEDDVDVAMAKKGAGEALKPAVSNFLQTLADGEMVVKGEEGAENVIPIKDRNVHSLIQLRQSIRSFAEQFQRGDPNKRALQNVLGSVDEEIEQLAGKAGTDGSVLKDYQNLRSGYKEARANLDSSTADKLTLNKPDKAMQDVGKWLMTGNNAPAKIATMRKVAGPTMDELSKSTIQGFKTMAEEHPDKFLKEWDKIPGPTKQAFFGDSLQDLQSVADNYRSTASASETARDQAIEAAKAQGKSAVDAAKSQGKETNVKLNEARNEYDTKTQATYDSEVKQAKANYDASLKVASDKAGQVLDKTSNPIVRALAEGRVSPELLKGQVDVKDVKDIKSLVGEDNWKNIFDGIVRRAVKESTVINRTGREGEKIIKEGRLNPQKLLNWRLNIKNDVFNEMAGASDPEFLEHYNIMMKQLQNAAGAKKLIKNGIVAPPTAAGLMGAAYVASQAIPAIHAFGVVGDLLGAASGLGGMRVGAVRNFIDYIADNPNIWNAIRAYDKYARPIVSPIGKAVVKKEIFNSANGMSGNLDNKKK